MLVQNTLTRKKEEFVPMEDNKVVMYICGLTPYDHAHVGHARAYVVYDVMKRYLEHKGYEVFHIQNITDVEDKVLKRSEESGIPAQELTEKFNAEAMELFRQLNILDADVYPKVTGHIPDIIGMVKKILENGYAYETPSGVYFDVSKFEGYGRLSGQKVEEMNRGARVEVEETKEDAADFALWKKAEGQLTFDSPWGRGRPGWHIECSAMGMKYSGGRTIDIHGGGRDLVFPHHENECAQAESALRIPFVKYWLHTGFLTVDGEKMSKSLGNFIVLKDLLEQKPACAVRMFFLQSHYRSPVDFSYESIDSAGEAAKRIFNLVRKVDEALEEGAPGKKDDDFRAACARETAEFYSAMDDDFDTPMALAHLFELAKLVFPHLESGSPDSGHLKQLKEEFGKMLQVLGLKEDEVEMPDLSKKLLDAMLELREMARMKKDFEMSDAIRDKLSVMGVVVEDTEKGPRWRIEKPK